MWGKFPSSRMSLSAVSLVCLVLSSVLSIHLIISTTSSSSSSSIDSLEIYPSHERKLMFQQFKVYHYADNGPQNPSVRTLEDPSRAGQHFHATNNQKFIYQTPSSSFANFNRYFDDRKAFWRRPSVMCIYDRDDAEHFNSPDEQNRHSKYIVINEPRSGSSWLQEISQMHPGIKVQFELDLEYGNDALQCKQCKRAHNPDTKFPHRLPQKLHPPQACGMTIFGSSNKFPAVAKLSESRNASLVILVRKNHVAHSVSAFRHFQKVPKHGSKHDLMVPWNFKLLSKNVEERRAAYDKLLQFPSETKRKSHVIFYEDMKRHPEAVWTEFQAFLGIPRQEIKDITELEKKSSSKPSIEYLTNLASLQREAQGTDWYDMIMKPNYDDELDLGAEFARICALYPDADISWRKHSCLQGNLVPRV